MDFARAASIALKMKATFLMRSELMYLPSLCTCARKTLLVLVVLYVLMRTISMFPIGTHIIMSRIHSIHNCGPLMPKICIIHLEYSQGYDSFGDICN